MYWTDWTIVGLYLVGICWLGRWYARRNKTTDDFLLGGRRMKALPIGLSIFVSWFSVISYTAIPGEMIRHGPMLWTGLLAAPVGLWFVGWVVIPRLHYMPFECVRKLSDFPRGKWTQYHCISAYELLDFIGCRCLGSTLFLLMRVCWMAMIVHIAATIIISPLTGFNPSLVSTVLVAATVLVTLGGFRAVVWTDCIQAAIMLAGAVVLICLFASWPTEWPEHWPEIDWSFNPFKRVTAGTAMLGAVCLGVCVRSGDQMNVQRYLSTSGPRPARNSFILSFIFDLLLTGLLVILGLGLLSWLQAGSDADEVLPRLIGSGLPIGMKGLVVAALLAAAVSSLSSGINACVSTVAVDWQQNLGPGTSMRNRSKMLPSPNCNVVESWHRAVPATVVLGIIVFILSYSISFVQGNLIELCYKVVNLLATPLGGLVLVALFFPKTRPIAAWLGCTASVAVVVWITYFSPITFLLASPLGLGAQLIIGGLSHGSSQKRQNG